MAGRWRLSLVLVVPIAATFVCAATCVAQQTASADRGAASSAAGDSGLQREYARLAQLLNSSDFSSQREALDALSRVRPNDVANPETRKLIARGYRNLAEEARGFQQDEAIRGLVVWGGKHSVPILIELSEKDKLRVSDEIFSALGQLRDPRGADAVARHLGNFFNHDAAVASLRRMGSAAEDALIKAAPSSDPAVSLAAVQLLGQVGGEKGLSVLQRATQARNPEIKQAAREAIKQIRARQKSGESVDAEEAVDPESPFADTAGPPVDIRARSTRGVGRAASAARLPRGPVGFPDFPDSVDDDAAGDELADLDEGDWTDLNAILPGDPAGDGVVADPPRGGATAGWKPQPVRLGNPLSVHERQVALSVASDRTPAAVVVHSDPFNKSIDRMELVGLQRRRSVGSTNVVGGVTQCYLSPSAARVLLVAGEGFHDRKARLDVWKLASSRPVEQASWWPFATSTDHWANDVTWAAWLDDEQLFTLNGSGTLVLWRLTGKSAKAIYQLDANSRSMPALSPGRAHLALATRRGVEVFRASDGELLARMADVRPFWGAMAFNGDGTRLACVSGGSVYIWDATTGRLERDFDCSELRQGDAVWLDDGHLLVGGSDIVDIERRLILWRYEGASDPAVSHGGWRWMVMKSGNVLGLVPAQLLQEEVLAAAEGLDPNELLALKPGAKVTLNIELHGDEQTRAEAALRAALEQNGVEVADDQPLRLSARIVTGPSETKEYGSGFFSRENREQVTLTEKRYEVELTVDGQSAWKQTSVLQSGHGPHVIWTQRGESAQQALDREAAQRAAGFSFSVAIPRYVVHPKYSGPLGTSKISLGGAR